MRPTRFTVYLIAGTLLAVSVAQAQQLSEPYPDSFGDNPLDLDVPGANQPGTSLPQDFAGNQFHSGIDYNNTESVVRSNSSEFDLKGSVSGFIAFELHSGSEWWFLQSIVEDDIGGGQDGSDICFEFFINSDDLFYQNSAFNEGNSQDRIASDNNSAPGSGFHTAGFIRDAADNTVKIFLDAQDWGEGSFSGSNVPDRTCVLMVGNDGQFTNTVDHSVFEVRLWDSAVEEEDLKTLMRVSDQTFANRSVGAELGGWLFGDELETEPVTPEPVDFADGIEDAIAAWGFRSSESQMFFAIASIGITMVATGTGLKIMRSGRTKNLIIAGAGALVAVFFVLVQMLEFWMLTVSFIIGAFTLMGGAREVRNTWQEVTEAGREMAREARLAGETETLEVDSDLVDEHPPGQRGPDLAPEGEEDALEVQVLGEASEPDLSPELEPEGVDE